MGRSGSNKWKKDSNLKKKRSEEWYGRGPAAKKKTSTDNVQKGRGLLLGIAIRQESRGPMIMFGNVCVVYNEGIFEDSRARGGKRQVTVLSAESWCEAEKAMSQIIPWTARRANLLVKGISFSPESVGKQLRIGQTVILEITGETTPCKRMDEAVPGLQEALKPDWRGGVTCRVIAGGRIYVGDTMSITTAA